MNAKELMIGDWVLDRPFGNAVVVKIDARDEILMYRRNRCYTTTSLSNIEPIPLTAEILERNGWEHGEISMEKRADENTHLCWTDRYGAVLYRNLYQMCDCKDVHELQHALRLCGLNELADNFKVE